MYTERTAWLWLVALVATVAASGPDLLRRQFSSSVLQRSGCDLDCSRDTSEPASVCGTDGITYESACMLEQLRLCSGSSTVIDHMGRCGRKQKAESSAMPSLLKMPSGMRESMAPRKAKRCKSRDLIRFKRELKRIFKKELRRIPADLYSKIDYLVANFSLLETNAQPELWKFSELDRNNDKSLEIREVRSLYKMAKLLINPESCTNVFSEECDPNRDEMITVDEWKLCINVVRKRNTESRSTSDKKDKKKKKKKKSGKRETEQYLKQ